MKRLTAIFICILLILTVTACNRPTAGNESEPESTSEQSTNSAGCFENDFEMELFSDKRVYKSNDVIKIWATLKYVGKSNEIKIWHGDPYITYAITDGKDFYTEPIVNDILTSTVLKKNELYEFEFTKSGGYSQDDPDAKFWEEFYNEKDLILPVGEYDVTVYGAFKLFDNTIDSGLQCSLKISVIK